MTSTTKPAFQLMTGRTIGFAAAFAIPLILVRCFSQADFGYYRELFLVFTTVFGVAQVGMAESLYFFVPSAPASAPRAVGNALLTLAGVGVLAAVVIAAAAPALAGWMNGPALSRYLPFLGIFLALMLVSAMLEIVMVARQQYRLASATYASSDVLRAVMLTVPALLTRRLEALLAGAIVFAAIRCLVLLRYLWHAYGQALRGDTAVLKGQLRYALPFAAAVTVEIIQTNLHQYAVAAWFDSATFAIYSVGCLQIPLVDLLATSAANVMMVRMSEELGRGRPVLPLWHHTIERLAIVVLPLTAVLIISAHDVIVALMTAKYAASVPIFIVSTTAIVLTALPVDAALRAYAQTRFLLWMNLFRLAFIVAGIGWFISTFSLPGAVLVTVLATAFAKVLALGRIARLTHVGAKDVLPWRALTLAAAATLAPVVPALFVQAHLTLPALPRAGVTTITYALGYGAAIGAIWLAARTGNWPSLRLLSSVEGQ